MRTLVLLALTLSTARPADAAWLPRAAERGAYSDAVTRLAQGRLEEAQAGFEGVLAADPTCGMAAHGLGMTRLRQGAVSAAISTLESAASAHPDASTIFVGLSTARFVAQDFAGSRTAAARAVSLEPDSIDAHAALQQVLLRQGDLDGARADLAAASARLPDPVLACFEVQVAAEAGDTSTAQARIDRCRRAGAPELVAAAVTRAGGGVDVDALGEMAIGMGVDAVVLLAQAVDRMNAGDAAMARDLLDTLLERHPHRTDARLLRGQVRAALGDTAGAKADLTAALDDGTWIDVYRSGAMSGILRKSDEERLRGAIAQGAGLLAGILVDEGDTDGADALLRRIGGQFPPHAGLTAGQARLAMARGDGAGAAGLLDQGLSTWPDDASLLDAASTIVLAEPRAATPRVAAALGRSRVWAHPHNLAVSQIKRGDPAACLQTISDARKRLAGSLPAEPAMRLAHVGLRCAAEAEDLPAARALLPRAGEMSGIPAVTRFNLALLEQKAERPDAAWRLVRDLVARPPADNPLLAQAVVGLGLRLHVEKGRLPEAIALAGTPEADPGDVHWLASKLAADGDLTSGRALLVDACPRLEGDAGVRCSALLNQLGGP
jgi:tetratricopeptide (TPR) repeat protein